MKKMGSGWRGPSAADRQREHLPGRRGPPARNGIAHLDAAPAHGRHVGGEIVALDRDIAEARPPTEELGQP